MPIKNTWIAAVLVLLACASCARAPLKSPEHAMRPASQPPELSDDLSLESLLSAVEQQLLFLEKEGPARNREFRFGPRVLSREQYLGGLRRFLALGRNAPDTFAFFQTVRREFEFYEVHGDSSWGEVFITSYFEPLLEGSSRPTERFSQPLYAMPDDLITLDLAAFDSKFSDERKLRGRLEGRALRPYFSREEIDVRGALRNRGLELCWVDPLDAFFLQIQGSGRVELEDGRQLRLNYAEKNGFPYEPVGRFLKPFIPPERIDLHSIEAYLRSLPREQMQSYLNLNPSYVFFRVSEESAVTYLGVPATDGRTIATDPRFFPKGALAFLTFDKPELPPAGGLPASLGQAPRTRPVGRFVLDQDIGGAIRGGGRVDLFWGRGAEAKRHAGVVKHPGRLYYLVPVAGVGETGTSVAPDAVK